MTTTVTDCRRIQFRKIAMPQGNITPIEAYRSVPFDIARVFFLYDIPVDSSRGGHAHKKLEQVIICAMGSFDVIIDDGTSRQSVHLRRADEGLYVPPPVWAELVNFSSGAVCVTLASHPYDEGDYLREYADYLDYRRSLS